MIQDVEQGTRWEELAQRLKHRRVVELGEPNLAEFARRRGLGHSRLLSDLEGARRVNYSDSTLLSLERWYELPGTELAEILGPLWPGTPAAQETPLSPGTESGRHRIILRSGNMEVEFTYEDEADRIATGDMIFGLMERLQRKLEEKHDGT